MEILEMLEKNKKNKIIMNKNNVMLLMQYIMDNNISNVRYFINNQLNLSSGGYNVGVKKIMNENSEFYNCYANALREAKKNTFEKIIFALTQMGILMSRGIKLEDGSYRNFDMYDWFVLKNKYFDNLNRKEISDILDRFSLDSIIYQEDINVCAMRSLISESFGDSFNSYSEIITKKYILSDTFNNLTEEEKKYLVSFMEANNIPFNYKNYVMGAQKLKRQRCNQNNIFKLELNQTNDEEIIKEENKVIRKKRP